MYRRKAIQVQNTNFNSLRYFFMNLNFNLRSIIKFELMGFPNPVYRLGKVIDVNSTEVVIIPQLKVYRKVKNFTYEDIDPYCSADDDCIIHIRRKLIFSWQYARATDLIITDYISESHTAISGEIAGITKNFNDYKFNFYDHETGLCKGDGSNCSYIKEAPND